MRLRDDLPELKGATLWLNSTPLKREDLVGTPLLIYFWSVSCGSCKKAMPQINQFYEDYQDVLNIVSVHMPRSEDDLDIDRVQEVARKHQFDQPIFVDNGYELTDVFRNRYVPAYYLFDKQGRLRHRQSGDGGMAMLARRLTRLIDQE